MSKTVDSVITISQIMAAKRAIETMRVDSLFTDPFAAILAGDELNSLQEKLQAKHGSQMSNDSFLRTRFVAVRTRFFDDFLSSKIPQLTQVVILGAGMDTRAFRLNWHPETHVYEIDHPEVITRKNHLLADAKPKCHRHSLGLDISQLSTSDLLELGYKPELPTVWLMEGLLMYLDELAVNNLLQIISDLSVTGSWLGADLISVKSLQVAQQTNSKIRKYWRFGTDFPTQLLNKYGWNPLIIQPGDEDANFGRYTKKLPPLNIPNLRRLFLVRASL